MKSQKDSPNVIAPPPLIYFGGILIGVIVSRGMGVWFDFF